MEIYSIENITEPVIEKLGQYFGEAGFHLTGWQRRWLASVADLGSPSAQEVHEPEQLSSQEVSTLHLNAVLLRVKLYLVSSV